jgi:D-glycero-beta-D-manno-heptose-7-phosphate kinase
MTGPAFISPERVDQLLGAMRGRVVVVVGDVMLDRYLDGDIERISPEAPVPVVRVGGRRASLGGAANVAANLAALGATPRLVGLVGNDPEAAIVRNLLAEAGIDELHLVIDADRPTTVKTRVIARGQQVVRIDEETDRAAGAALSGRLEAAGLVALAGAHALVLEDYDKGALVPALIRSGIAAARERGLPVVVDPKLRNFFEYAGATVFKPNRRELMAAMGRAVDPDDPASLAAVLAGLEVEHLLLTLGAGGMLLASRSGEGLAIPAVAREVFDVSGAGDTVTAWVAAALAAGASAAEAALLANRAAAVEVAKAGVRTVLPEEVRSVRIPPPHYTGD